eukprot:gnl/TRDRNA2_/TRDRNA2_199779_c0_seq1.p1 gnl/TRDRNA2_/TRDRNA2_199779_c0~~gnl/TRDRNA2_/TRDRNA2_199779_c0_seq1.p1  ORF type:complete len:243 (+),score=29.07 gnl/TRDRNA2_/TRDRNA2_199779_c0_seq1:105-731(+)
MAAMGTVVSSAPMQVGMARAAPVQQQCQVQIPQGVEPGGKFIATTPDGQQVEVTCPPGVNVGDSVTFGYMPRAPAATVVGQPVGMPYGGGMGGMYGMEYMESEEERRYRQDQTGASMGWIMYLYGWALCCCCGPIGIIFWYMVACLHWCKPKEQRQHLQQERSVALVSLYTGVFCSIITISVVIVFSMNKKDLSAAENQNRQRDNRWL